MDKDTVLGFIRSKVAPAIVEVGVKEPKVVVDKALRITAAEIREELKEGGVNDALPPLVMPRATAKYLSPLDNTLWHELKDRVRKRKPTTASGMAGIIREEWNAITPAHLHHYYHHCGLTRRSDPHTDLD